jgi:hypothetical protein
MIEKIKEQMERKLRELHQWDNEIKIPLPGDFKVIRPGREISDGFYLTLRIRSGCMYQMLNEMREGHWQAQVLDDSETVMYKEVPDRLYQILTELDALDAEKKRLENPEPPKTEEKEEDKPKED